jgi:gas vesicle protein
MRLVIFAVVTCLAACKADAQRCEQAARNFATLVYWKKADAEIAKEPPDRRASVRKKKLSQFTSELEGQIDTVVSQCQNANNDEQIECMIAAKTAEEALACAELASSD